jgi:hypothetical protein
MRQGRRDPRRRCRVLCAPTVALMPALLRTHLLGGPRVRNLTTSVEGRLPSTSNLEVVVSASSRTAIPRVSLYGSVQWLPNANAQRNPFTQYTASELGEPVRANAPTATLGASASVLPASSTDGWADLAVNVADLFSQAGRPGDASEYTHKLDLELLGHAHVFAWTPPAAYLHRVSVALILDYVASGLPRAGDEVPLGRRFLSDARPLSLIAGLELPLTPTTP